MQQKLLTFSLLAIAAAVAPAHLSAQNLNALNGNWTFNIQGLPLLSVSRPPITNDTAKSSSKAVIAEGQANSFAIAGQFQASIGVDRAGNQIGLLAITATTSLDGSTIRSEGDVGRYQINSSGTGGSLTMNLSSYPMQYDFWFAKGGTVINIVSTLAGKPATGFAVRGPLGCPAGVDPLTLLSGAYVFKFQHIAIASANFNNAYGSAGRLVASIGTNRANQPVGLLSITATSDFTMQQSVTRLEKDAGSFQINSDCSGGTLTFNLSSKPYQYEFYFNADFSELFVINTSGVPIYGVVTKTNVSGVCPLSPLSLLNGPWTFNMQTLTKLFDQSQISVAGRWVASQGANAVGQPVGLLKINATTLRTSLLGTNDPTRLEMDAGSFQINSDCTGGTLTMNLSSFPMQYDFWFYDNYQKMYFVSTTPGRGATGSATVGVTGCPIGITNNLDLLSGMYGFRAQRVPDFTLEPFGIAGVFNVTPAPGQIAIRATSSLLGGIARLEGDIGRYQIDADCTGGILQFNLTSRPTQYQFYFRNGFQEADIISLIGPAAYGVFTTF